jgi:hypothetical protein
MSEMSKAVRERRNQREEDKRICRENGKFSRRAPNRKEEAKSSTKATKITK